MNTHSYAEGRREATPEERLAWQVGIRAGVIILAALVLTSRAIEALANNTATSVLGDVTTALAAPTAVAGGWSIARLVLHPPVPRDGSTESTTSLALRLALRAWLIIEVPFLVFGLAIQAVNPERTTGTLSVFLFDALTFSPLAVMVCAAAVGVIAARRREVGRGVHLILSGPLLLLGITAAALDPEPFPGGIVVVTCATCSAAVLSATRGARSLRRVVRRSVEL